MRKIFLLAGIIIGVSIVLTGCASNPNKYLPKTVLTKPENAVSVPHPIEIEREKIRAITKFIAIMDPGLWTEVVYGGGVWPALAQDNNGKISRGYGFLTGVNFFGDFLIQFILSGTETKSRESRIIYLNRDNGWAYTLLGQEIKEYDPKKFDKDKKFQKKIFDKGTTLSEIESFWKNYSKDKGIPNEYRVQGIKVGSQEWDNYKKEIKSNLKYNYKMPGGQIRCGYLPLKNFRQIASEMPGFSGAERWLEKAKLPLISLPFTGIGLLYLVGTSIVSDAVTAGIDDSWSGFYGRATVIRYELAPLFRQISEIYKKLLEIRDKRIKDLEFELYMKDITTRGIARKE
ncbi:MAG: hypothetical protein U9P90_02575 [Patescibacteria group bacterium]|nr:hypothetical protein [Patescibacteria group bacterium]